MSSFYDDYNENALTPGRRLRRWWCRVGDGAQILIAVGVLLAALFVVVAWTSGREEQACRDRGGEPVHLYRSMVCLAPGVVR